jgi:dihydroxy-acid dehydratase
MKTSVISPQFHDRFLSSPSDPMAFEGVVAVFDGPEDYHRRIDVMEGITPETILIMRGAGPQGYPGAAEVVNMIPPAELVKQGIEVGQEINGFSAHVSYPASETGDKVEPVDHLASSTRRKADVKLSAKQIEGRKEEMGLYRQNRMPPSQTPWQEIYRKEVGELSEGMVLKGAVKYQRVAQTMGIPRRNH